MGGSNDDQLSEQILTKLDRLGKLIEEGNHLQKLALLGPDRELGFIYRGQLIKLHLPFADRDYIQRGILRTGSFYEQRLLNELCDVLPDLSHSVVCDIGANIGNHSVFFGKILGANKVISFEPQPGCFDILKRNLEINDLPTKYAKQLMLGAENGAGEIASFKSRNTGGTSFRAASDGDVKMVTLDSALSKDDAERVLFLKIDVEGFQMMVLKGAKRLLKSQAPTILVELAKGEVEETSEYLESFGYQGSKFVANNFLFVKK